MSVQLVKRTAFCACISMRSPLGRCWTSRTSPLSTSAIRPSGVRSVVAVADRYDTVPWRGRPSSVTGPVLGRDVAGIVVGSAPSVGS